MAVTKPGMKTRTELSGDVSNSSNTTNVSLNSLSTVLEGGKTYLIEMTLIFKSAATNTGISIAYGGGTAGISTIVGYNETSTSATADGRIPFTSTTANTTFSTSAAANVNQLLDSKMIVSVSTTGTFVPQFRSETNGTVVVSAKYSTLSVEEI
jgi:hypothetical protein